MNKTAIKNFAVWARNKLIADISYRAGLMGITERGIASALPQSTGTTEFYDIGTAEPYAISGDAVRQRRRLVELIERKAKETDYETAYKYIIEEVAYTWFNRLIAIRFMEINDYLPSHIRVISSESGKMEPDLVTTPFDADLTFSKEEELLVLKMKQENKLDELFRMLFVKQCNALYEYLPELFEPTKDYTELLLNLSVTDHEGVIHHLINDIEEKYFKIRTAEDEERFHNGEISEDELPVGQVEIIGWLYQYYNYEPKNEAFSKKGKVRKEEIPAMTQLFTPDWIVRYMVENSLGRLWVEGHKDCEIQAEWKYYVADEYINIENLVNSEVILNKAKDLSPENLKIIDPCMGSGHVLVYAFDVLMQIYESAGYSRREAASYIIEKNLYGLDIDERARQFAYFAVMMKAREYDRRILNKRVKSNIYSFQESKEINKDHIQYMGNGLSKSERSEAIDQLNDLLFEFINAKELGSIIHVEEKNWELLYRFINDISLDEQYNFDTYNLDETQMSLKKLIDVAQILSGKYDVVITNPPYLAISGTSTTLNDYVKQCYPDSKTDLFSVFIEKCHDLTAEHRYQAMITQHSWMFLSSYEKLRLKMQRNDIVNMIHLGARAFEDIAGEVVQTTSFILRNSRNKGYKGTYFRLLEGGNQHAKEEMFLNRQNQYVAEQHLFEKITGEPIAYWASAPLLSAFENGEVLKLSGDTRQGMATSDNNRFLRLWYEIDISKLGLNCATPEEAVAIGKKWYPYNKGGEFRKWYGNIEYTINYENDGYEVKEYATSLYRTPSRTIKSMSEYFKECLSWSKISTGSIAFRYYPQGFVFDVAGCCIFYRDPKKMYYDFAFLNSKIAKSILSVISPTLNYEAGHVASLPMIREWTEYSRIEELVIENIQLSKEDWDSFENSWDFKKHPLVRENMTIENAFAQWSAECDERFKRVKNNEEELNRIFIKVYGMESDLSPEIDDKEVTIRRANLQREIKSLISYAVGCIFGRYSLDKEKVVYAGGKWDSANYTSFEPDADGIIPITDEEYLEDDIVSRFVSWTKQIYGESNIEQNLDYIAKALQGKGNSSREIIRNYFLNEFYKDHASACSVSGSGKRPIYWMFDSGKQNGFKALIYLHRYSQDTIGSIRVDYLHRLQRIYESEVNRMQEMIDHSSNSREITLATKRKEKLVKQIKECREYDEKISHLALSRIALDLDDGVKANYEKMQTATDGKKYVVLAKI